MNSICFHFCIYARPCEPASCSCKVYAIDDCLVVLALL